MSVSTVGSLRRIDAPVPAEIGQPAAVFSHSTRSTYTDRVEQAKLVGGVAETERHAGEAARLNSALKPAALRAITSKSGIVCGFIQWSNDRMTMAVLDVDKNVRVVLSVDEQPAFVRERFRGTLRLDKLETMLHVVLVDGDLPTGTTTLSTPPTDGGPMHYPTYTKVELLSGSGTPWAHVTMPEFATGLEIALFTLGGEVVRMALRCVGESRVEIGGVSRPQAWISIDVDPNPRAPWLLPALDPAGSLSIVSKAGVTCAALRWSENRMHVAVLDADNSVRIVITADEQPSHDGERLRTSLRALGSGETMLYVLLVDGGLPIGTTSQYMTP